MSGAHNSSKELQRNPLNLEDQVRLKQASKQACCRPSAMLGTLTYLLKEYTQNTNKTRSGHKVVCGHRTMSSSCSIQGRRNPLASLQQFLF